MSRTRSARSENGGNRNATRSGSVTDTNRPRKRRYSDDSGSDSSESVNIRRLREASLDATERNTRRKRREDSPPERGRRRDSSTARGSRRDYRTSSSRSRERSYIARSRRSLTHEEARSRERPPPPQIRADKSMNRGGMRQAPRDRSLSPFSKRLALTQAMNMG